jgi:hypothetical protein
LTDLIYADVPDQTVGASLLAMTACQPTAIHAALLDPVGAGLPAMAAYLST